MPFIAPFEELAMKKGFEQGRQEGRQEGNLEEARKVLIEFLNMRFTDIPSSIYESIQKIDQLSRLRDLRKEVITATSLNEFLQRFNSQSP